jgi:hypothetical protein
MKTIKSIADNNAELFIKKHFAKLKPDDGMVVAIRKSVKETIQKALEAYESETYNPGLK